jgi:predicted DNA-binding protein (UPF0251 family)
MIHGAPIPEDRALFKPAGMPMEGLPINTLTIVEFEAIRLIDAEDKSQNDAAALMKISQPTISRILSAARKKVADALVCGKGIKIEGGDFKFVSHASCSNCGAEFQMEDHGTLQCPKCKSTSISVPNSA